ncbi:unnamed protein product [Rotaria sordida]|uniref:NAD(P)(+)--arginine ADP-ribosyltransferase n=1 Tax=Rotaria sordida TaxID=392033 RepID=A0A815K5W8_9BILA|nr:unnamed protein product [Rotaria sordida]CAF1620328.1 unnamed protein product [Rotaria sordida]
MAENVTTTNDSLKSTSCQIVENFVFVWIDSNFDEPNEKNQQFISKLENIVNSIQKFTDIDQCIEFLAKIKDENIFLLISDPLGRKLLPLIQQYTQIYSIYTTLKQQPWMKQYDDIKNVVSLDELLNILEQDIRQLNNDLISMNIIPQSLNTDLNRLEPSFMYFQLLKENLFVLEYDQHAFDELVTFCRTKYHNKKDELKIIDKFQKTYDKNTAIKWYTDECFVYHMLNKALRMVNIETIMKFGLVLHDIYYQIEQRHLESKYAPALHDNLHVVYRGKRISNTEFEKIKRNIGGLISFNNFLSTSEEFSVASRFATVSRSNKDKIGVIFTIKIDPLNASAPYASIKDISLYDNEKEVLFSISSIFRIDEVSKCQKNKRFWQVDLSLTSDNDPQLRRLTDHMRHALGGGDVWHRMGQLMIKIGELKKAEEIFGILLEKVPQNDRKQCAFLCNQLGYIWKQKGNLDNALHYYKSSLATSLNYLPSNDPLFSSVYSNIGGILKKQGKLDEALKYYQRVLQNDLSMFEPNQIEIAIDYNNIGAILEEQGKYSDALKSYDQALEIKLAHLPPNHPSLAKTYMNIGSLHHKMDDNAMAITYYEKALANQQRSLLSNDPSLMITHIRLADLYESLHKYKEAVEHRQSMIYIARQILGDNHAEVQKEQKYLDELRKKI